MILNKKILLSLLAFTICASCSTASKVNLSENTFIVSYSSGLHSPIVGGDNRRRLNNKELITSKKLTRLISSCTFKLNSVNHFSLTSSENLINNSNIKIQSNNNYYYIDINGIMYSKFNKSCDDEKIVIDLLRLLVSSMKSKNINYNITVFKYLGHNT